MNMLRRVTDTGTGDSFSDIFRPSMVRKRSTCLEYIQLPQRKPFCEEYQLFAPRPAKSYIELLAQLNCTLNKGARGEARVKTRHTKEAPQRQSSSPEFGREAVSHPQTLGRQMGRALLSRT